MSDIGERIKELRSEAGITQLQLGKYAGCTGQVISNIERGYTRPSAEVLNKIADCVKSIFAEPMFTGKNLFSIKKRTNDNRIIRRSRRT